MVIGGVRIEQKKKIPELLKRPDIVDMSNEELKSKINRMLAWAVKECRDNKSLEMTSAESRLL